VSGFVFSGCKKFIEGFVVESEEESFDEGVVFTRDCVHETGSEEWGGDACCNLTLTNTQCCSYQLLPQPSVSVDRDMLESMCLNPSCTEEIVLEYISVLRQAERNELTCSVGTYNNVKFALKSSLIHSLLQEQKVPTYLKFHFVLVSPLIIASRECLEEYVPIPFVNVMRSLIFILEKVLFVGKRKEGAFEDATVIQTVLFDVTRFTESARFSIFRMQTTPP